LTDPVLTDAVARYLAVRDDAEATADFVVDAIRGASPRVRADALEVVVSRRDVAVLLDARRLEPLAGWLRDANVSPLEKSNVLVRLARRQAPGLGDIARPLADAAGPLQAAAIDALITIDQPPPPERLLALSRLPDEPLRLVTGRGLAKLGTPEAITRLSELFGEPISASVRIAIIQGFGRTANPRVTEMLARELARPEKDVAMAAAEGLVQQGSDEAIAVLAKTLEEGRPDSKMASAFALKRMNRAETDEILENLERTSPDPEVRRLCKLALGESMHEH
jgi:HEAT repeat protein